MFDETRWQRLIEQFRQENYNLYQLSSQSVFTVVLQAGLSALKTPYPFSNFYYNLSYTFLVQFIYHWPLP